MNYGSVCSGVEAASLAWEPLGWKALFYAEVEPFPSAVLCHRFGATRPLRPLDPAAADTDKDRKLRESWARQIAELPPAGRIPNLGDFTQIQKGDYDGKIDLLVGGTPCQDLSIAGKRLGFEGNRSVLALDFVRLCFELGTRWVCWENVPATLSSHNGEDFGRFLSLLCGWDIPVPGDGWRKAGIVTNAPGHFGVSWRILDTQYTRVSQFPRAIPQRRKRLFLVGYLDRWIYPAKVLFDGEMCGGNTPPRRTKGKIAPAGLGSGVAAAEWWDGSQEAGTLTRTSDQQFMPDKGRLQCVVEKDAECIGKAISFYPQRKAESVNPSEECANTLTNAGAPGFQNAICFENHAQDSRIKPTSVAQAITARMGTGGGNLPLIMEHSQELKSERSVEPSGKEEDVSREDGEQSISDSSVLGFIKNDAGGDQQGYWKEVFPTMRTEITPAVAREELVISFTANDNGRDCAEECAPTLRKGGETPKDGGPIVPAVTQCFNVSFCDANGRRKDRKNGGLYVTPTETSKTVTTGGVNAETVIIDPFEMPIALDGDKIGKKERSGGSGLGVSEEGVMYTQTTTDIHAVAYAECVPLDLRNATRDPEKQDAVNRQGVGVGNDGEPMHTISASNVPGVGWQASVRRLLPLETERLMGFPDGHTQIPWRGKTAEECPDAPRYKVCGNSMAVNVMAWLGMRIQQVEEQIPSLEAISQVKEIECINEKEIHGRNN